MALGALMATFNYSVRDRAGKVVTGKLDGDNQAMVRAKLSQMGYMIIELNQQSSLAALGELKLGTGVKQKDVSIFARQFATMINAGLSLTKCLSILGSQTESLGLRQIVAQMAKDIEAALAA